MKLVSLLLWIGLAGTIAPVVAQPVYRCGSEYTRVPCSAGRTVDVDATASRQQSAEARQVVERERRLGNDMERDRLRREAALKPARAGSLSPSVPSAQPASASLKPKRRAKAKIRVVDGGDFLARVPKDNKATKETPH